MPYRLLAVALALAGSALLKPNTLAAQDPAVLESAARLRPSAPTLTSPVRLHSLTLPDTAVSKRKDHTVTGLIIGGGLGFVAGWVFYNTICEAVDNNCSDSRVPLLVFGTTIGGALGALAGSASD